MLILKADLNDLVLILELQYLAYQSEAKLLNDYSIQPLNETLDEITKEYQNGIILKAINDNEHIIGSVRCQIKGKTMLIGKLVVHPVMVKHFCNTFA